MQFKTVIPTLRSFDEAKAKEFYVDWLGFTIDFEHRFEPNTPLYMSVSRGGCTFHLSEHHGDGSPGIHVRVEVPELEAFHAELHSRPYKNYRPGLEDMEWGSREMAVQDGAGNKLIFYRWLTDAEKQSK